MVIAVDGPAGAGKSTVCRILAEKLGYAYLDSGAMYRAVAWSLLRESSIPEEASAVALRLPRLPLRFGIQDGRLVISHQGKVMDEELRQPEISQWASRISQIAAVRSFLTEWQRRLAATGNVVAEGRDMTTVVFPDAGMKVYLTADLATRAQRRFAEYQGKNISVDYATLQAQIHDRDQADQERALAPLRPASDALIVDTSQMEIAEVVGMLLESLAEKTKK